MSLGFAAAVCGLLLLPTATLLYLSCRRLHSAWGVVGTLIYGLGWLAVIATGISTPFQQPYVPIHIYLAFLAFMSLVAGLAICHAVMACLRASARLRQADWAVLLMSAFLCLTYVFFTPRYFDGCRGFLAVSERVLAAIIAASTVALTLVMAETVCLRGDSCGESRSTEPDCAANGSQPIRSETNSTSSAAGSRRRTLR